MGQRRKRARSAPTLKKLSDLEMDVMSVVWDLEDCSSAEVIARFQKQRSLAPTTIRTVLNNVEKKGYVKRVPSLERGYRFRPVVRRETVAELSLRRVVSSLFDNSPRLAVAYLLKDERLNEEDLKEIRRLLRGNRTSGSETQ